MAFPERGKVTIKDISEAKTNFFLSKLSKIIERRNARSAANSLYKDKSLHFGNSLVNKSTLKLMIQLEE